MARAGVGDDTGAAKLLLVTRALRLRSLPVSLAYASTSGVYGDCQGALVPETRTVEQQFGFARGLNP